MSRTSFNFSKRKRGGLEILQDGLGLHLEAGNINSFDFSNSTTWTDLIGGTEMEFYPDLASWTKLDTEKALENNIIPSNNEHLRFPVGKHYSHSNNDGFTYGAFFKYIGRTGSGNPGFIRQGGGFTRFWILSNGNTRRLWIRVNDQDHIKDTSVFEWSNTAYTYMTVSIGGVNGLSVCFDGIEIFNIPLPGNLATMNFDDLIENVIGQHILAKWRSVHIYRRELTPIESLYNYNQLLNLYK
jgi:hypothetical protein